MFLNKDVLSKCPWPWVWERGAGAGLGFPLDFEIIGKMVVFSILRRKTKFHQFWSSLEKFLGKSPTAPH